MGQPAGYYNPYSDLVEKYIEEAEKEVAAIEAGKLGGADA